VFVDPLAVIFDDEWHSQGEEREIIIGQSANGRLLLVSFSERLNGLSALVKQRGRSARIMKKMPISKEQDQEDDLLSEYSFDYRKAKSNRFAIREDQRVIVLDPDVAEHFKDSESVNRLLRALIGNMPQAV
jgi:hypothetical protein